MFPLGTVLFPTMVLPLRIFEPRYLEMIAECLADDGAFGVVLIERGFEVGGGDVRFDIGCMAEIVHAASLPDGQQAVVSVGTDRFRVAQWLDDAPYPRAVVEPFDRPLETDLPIADLDQKLRRHLALVSESGVDVGPLDFEMSREPAVALDQLCALAPLGALDSQRLLSSSTSSDQAALLASLLDAASADLMGQLGSR